jgi:flagellar hook-length control protein FliK
MPSPTTTNITVGSLLELLTPPAPPSRDSDDQPAFDSLLQLPPERMPPSPPPASDESPPPLPLQRKEEKSESSREDDPLPLPPEATDPPPLPPQAQDGHYKRVTESVVIGAAFEETTQSHGEKDSDEQSSQQVDDVVAQCLAAMPTAQPTIVSTDSSDPADFVPAAASALTETTDELPPSDQTLVPIATEAISTAKIRLRRAADLLKGDETPEAEASEPVSAVNATEVAEANPLVGSADSAALDIDQSSQHGTHLQLAREPIDERKDAPETSKLEIDPVRLETTGETHVESQDRRQASGEQNLTATAAQQLNDVPTGPVVPPSITTPPVSTVAAPTPLTTNTDASGSSGTPAISGDSTTSGSRSRLPAGVLTRTNATHRRAPLEIDTTRLLNRVARAFAIAPQRGGEIRLRLSPPELGSLHLQVQVLDGALIAHLETETADARSAVIDNLPALRERLAEQGIRVERFDVDLMYRQPGGTPNQPGDQKRETVPLLRASNQPRPRSQTPTPTASPVTAATAPGGLNVIV